jgi:hypothetical protein
MTKLEELTRGSLVKGILPNNVITVIDVTWHGSAAVEVTYKDSFGKLGSELIYRDSEETLQVDANARAATTSNNWSIRKNAHASTIKIFVS